MIWFLLFLIVSSSFSKPKPKPAPKPNPNPDPKPFGFFTDPNDPFFKSYSGFNVDNVFGGTNFNQALNQFVGSPGFNHGFDQFNKFNKFNKFNQFNQGKTFFFQWWPQGRRFVSNFVP